MQKKITALILIIGLGLFGLYTFLQSDDIVEVKKSDVPDFAAISDVNAKKTAFFNYLQPAFDVVTAEVLAERALLSTWQAKAALTTDEQTQLQAIADMYKVKATTDQQVIAALLIQVDVIPEELVFSQSANETGWGTSRFAKQGHNFFGQWCFSKGCGIVPNQRDQGADHEVASFDSIEASVRSYFRNINRNQSYLPLRDIRSELRINDESINACALAAGLINYSERKAAYIDEIRAMIRHNRKFWRNNTSTDYALCAAPEPVVTEIVEEDAIELPKVITLTDDAAIVEMKNIDTTIVEPGNIAENAEDAIELPEVISLTVDSTFVEAKKNDSKIVESNKTADNVKNDTVTAEEPIKSVVAE
ncbi:glucosaminidase domain-containing protein [Moritella sp. Urea-trap-13]|uniref:glucosaminidase domain-containing protein n=1 Tax=Moritella sp. Urea-trap-13 TaxID=2058327 RepID=UPI000C32EDC2|nr:glucosaminidase domain-containing protein [Moritella sp. Urea-trap-13]PKH05873.1 Bax protein [Moritella sp. Urea-trap-13]